MEFQACFRCLRIFYLYLGFVVLFSISSDAFAKARLSISPQSVLWLEGDSTLHRFSSTATILNADIHIDESEQTPLSRNRINQIVENMEVKIFYLSIPINGLKSGESGLDKNMYKTLKSNAYPEIRFSLSGYETIGKDHEVSGIRAKGRLSMAGKENDCLLTARTLSSHDSMVISGSKELLMTDFGIQPPQLMFGAIKTKDKIVVHYMINLILTDEK